MEIFDLSFLFVVRVSCSQSTGLLGCIAVFPLIFSFKGNFSLHTPFSEKLCCVLIDFSIEYSVVSVCHSEVLED